MSRFSFGNNLYKNKESFKNFSPQILEVYRILLVQTTQEASYQELPETSYQTSHLVQNICISVYLYNVLGNF